MKDELYQQEKNLMQIARKYYTNLPYHNFYHVLQTLNNADNIIQRVKKDGIKVDELVVKHAVLFHDAGYDKDPKKLGFDDKEEYSASIATKELSKLRYPKNHVDKVASCILATKRHGNFKTVEQKIVRAADLAGLMSDYRTFRENTLALKREYEFFTGKRVTEAIWKEQLKELRNTMNFYLSQDINLTAEHDDPKTGESIFHRNLKRNFARFLEDEES